MRLGIQKTLKMYVGGKFIRSESGRVLPITSSRGEVMYSCSASRKDLRNTVEIARAAQPGWAARTAYNRGQILYRLAEMLDDRLDTLPTSKKDAQAAVDRAVHHAGWTDKIGAVLSSVNPTATGHVNYSMVRGMGIVAAIPDASDSLLGMVESLCAALAMANSVILFVPAENAELATALSEAVATSDVPAGVVNILTADIPAVLEWVNKHDDIDALYLARTALPDDTITSCQEHAARVFRRLILVDRAQKPAGPAVLGQLCELKTVWMSA